MALEDTLYSTLAGLVSGRVFPNVFQQPDGTLPPWPSIRYTISRVPVEDICGDGDDETADAAVQIDVVAATHRAMLSIRLDTLEAMRTLYPPARLQISLNEYDDETRTYRAVLRYDVSGSSDSPP